MKNNKEVTITIPIMLYEDLILTRQNYFKIINYLFDNATLSYYKERIIFDKDLDLIKYLCPKQYNSKLEELREKEKEKESEKEN